METDSKYFQKDEIFFFDFCDFFNRFLGTLKFGKNLK